jgi:hypothetical protein
LPAEKPKRKCAPNPAESEPPELKDFRRQCHEIFGAAYLAKLNAKYARTLEGSAQLKRLQKQQGEYLTLTAWETAVKNYIASPMSKYSLEDLASRYAVFKNSALDRFNKPITETAGDDTTHSNGNSNGETREQRQKRLMREKFGAG